MTTAPPDCCLCGEPCEPWHAELPTGYGHNPYPLSTDPEQRCCDGCNEMKVIPARIRGYINRKQN